MRTSLNAEGGGPRGLRRGENGHTLANYAQFEDLLARFLELDPEKRITAAEALEHDFFKRPAHLVTLPDATGLMETSTDDQPAAAVASSAARYDFESPDMFKETANKKYAAVNPPAPGGVEGKSKAVASKPVATGGSKWSGKPAPSSGRRSV